MVDSFLAREFGTVNSREKLNFWFGTAALIKILVVDNLFWNAALWAI